MDGQEEENEDARHYDGHPKEDERQKFTRVNLPQQTCFCLFFWAIIIIQPGMIHDRYSF